MVIKQKQVWFATIMLLVEVIGLKFVDRFSVDDTRFLNELWIWAGVTLAIILSGFGMLHNKYTQGDGMVLISRIFVFVIEVICSCGLFLAWIYLHSPSHPERHWQIVFIPLVVCWTVLLLAANFFGSVFENSSKNEYRE